MQISVVTPTLALDDFLIEARASVARQAAGIAIEHIIVVDDPAVPLPPEVVEGNVHTRFLHNSRGKGPGGARNTALDQATGAFVFFLDADDIWSDNHVRRALSVYESNPWVDCVSVAGLSFGEHVKRPRGTIPDLPQGVISRRSVAWNPVGCPTGFSYRRDGRTSHLRFKDAIYFQDIIFYLELLHLGAVFWRENGVRYWYRRSQGQLTSIVPIDNILKSEGLVHHSLAQWKNAGLSSWEVLIASVQIRRLSANRQRRRNYLDTLFLAVIAPAWALGQVTRLAGDVRVGRLQRQGASLSPGQSSLSCGA